LAARPSLEGVNKPLPYIKKQFDDIFNDNDCVKGKLPDENEIYNWYRNVITRCKMEKECLIISLIYIERLYNCCGVYITELNWKHMAFITLSIGSKVWDDESYENVHFAIVFPRFTKEQIAEMESLFLSLVDFNVAIKSSEYAKYYFILRTYAEKNKRSFPLQPLDVDTVRKLQTNSANAGDNLRKYHAEFLFKTK
jgi:hypothetical protein